MKGFRHSIQSLVDQGADLSMDYTGNTMQALCKQTGRVMFIQGQCRIFGKILSPDFKEV